MTKKEVLQKTMNFLSEEMKGFGFDQNLKEQGFIRKNTDSIYFYQVLIYDITNIKTAEKGFQIEPLIWVHVNQIEKYFKEVTLNKVLKKDTDFKTIGETIAELIANPTDLHKKWNASLDLFVFEEKNIQYVGWEILKHFKNFALSYCLKYGSVAAVDKLANTYPFENIVHFQNENQRVIKGVIAAKLNNNPALDKLVETYDQIIIKRDMYDTTKEEMRRVKELLPLIIPYTT